MTKTKTQKQRANAQKSAHPQKAMVKKASSQQPRKGLSTKMSRNSFNYLVSLLFPFTQPSRVPDPCQLSTSMYQLTYDFSLALSTGGVGGVYVTLNSWPQVYIENVTTTTDSAFTYNSVVTPSMSSIQGTFTAVRPVSSSLHFYSTNSDTNNSGRSLMWTQAANFASILEVNPTNGGAVLQMRDNWGCPAREGGFLRYKPTDVTSDMFTSTLATNFTRGVLGIHLTGCATNAVFVFRLIVNYEGIASSDQLSYQSSQQSPSDGVGYDVIRGIMSRVSSFATYPSVEKMLSSGGQLLAVSGIAYAQRQAEQLVRAYGAYVG